MNTIKWGIIGPGNIAKQFINDLQWSKYQHEVVAIVGHEQQPTVLFANEFSIPGVYTNLTALIKDNKADLIYIATPHPAHFEQVKECLNAKLPVLCEKPIVINAEQCKELIKLSKKNNTFLMEAMWIRFLPSILQVLRLISENKIGKIISIKSTISFKAPGDKDNRYFNPDKGGGSLLDLGVYSVFLATLLLGKPAGIKAIGKLSDTGVDESACILLQYENGAYAMLDSSLAIETHLPAEITGEGGIIRINDPWFEKAKGIELSRQDDGSIVYQTEWEGHGLHFEIDEVIQQIEKKRIESDRMDHSFSLSILEIMDEIREQIGVSYDKYE